MTVRELINELECFDKDMDIIVIRDAAEQQVPVMSITDLCIGKTYGEDGIVDKLSVAIIADDL